ncbi:hypothetical protein EGW08_010120, partial [Elysia chlorotica]
MNRDMTILEPVKEEATSSAIHFDSSTKAVMAEATHENIKEKVLAVREVVPGKSNNEVILVLQYYDYCVERTIQAYLEDGAKEALQEWNFTGTKPKKRKNKKKPASAGVNGEKSEAAPSSSTSAPAVDGTKQDGLLNGDAGGLPNGDLPHDACKTDQASTSAASEPQSNNERKTSGQAAPMPQRQSHNRSRGSAGQHRLQLQHNSTHHDARERTVSEVSTGSGVADGASKRPFHGLEKALKDIHRQTTSLERLRNLLDHEIDRSYRSVKTIFEDLRQGLDSREAQIFGELEQLKKEASEMLEMRQSKAADLRRQVDRSERMTESEVSDLRAEVKHFVSERRHDEELGRVTRFVYDSDHLLAEIGKFGEVVHVRSVSTARRASSSSVASSVVSHEGNAEVDAPNSQEINELQDRLKNSLKLQTTQSTGVSSSLENGSSDAGLTAPKSVRRRFGNSHRGGNTSRSREGGVSDVRSDGSPSPASQQHPPAASSRTERHSNNNSSSNHHQQQQQQGYSNSSNNNSSNYYTSNTGSPGRGGNRQS